MLIFEAERMQLSAATQEPHLTPVERLVKFFGNQPKTAAAMGVSQATVSYWLSGTYTMTADNAFKAEDLTKGYVTARELVGSGG